MKNLRKGEIATVLTIGALIVLGVTSFISSNFLKNKQTITPKAEGPPCVRWIGPGPNDWEPEGNGTGFACESYDKCNKGGACDNVCCKPGTVRADGAVCNQSNGECYTGTAWGSIEPTQPACSPGKVDASGQCNPACCDTNNGNADCPGQVCGVPNGACGTGTKGYSCGTNKYVRTCNGATCAWTFCDGVNFPDAECASSPVDNADNRAKGAIKCDSDDACRTGPAPTTKAGVNKCINSLGAQESCPATYNECCGQGFARKVHKNCTQSNTSGCSYYCEDGKGGRVDCGDAAACSVATNQCTGRYLPTVAPTARPQTCPGVCDNRNACPTGQNRSTYAPFNTFCKNNNRGNYCCLRTAQGPTPTPGRTVTPVNSPTPIGSRNDTCVFDGKIYQKNDQVCTSNSVGSYTLYKCNNGSIEVVIDCQSGCNPDGKTCRQVTSCPSGGKNYNVGQTFCEGTGTSTGAWEYLCTSDGKKPKKLCSNSGCTADGRYCKNYADEVPTPTGAPIEAAREETSTCTDNKLPVPVKCPKTYDAADGKKVTLNCSAAGPGGACQYTCFDRTGTSRVDCGDGPPGISLADWYISIINGLDDPIKIQGVYIEQCGGFGFNAKCVPFKTIPVNTILRKNQSTQINTDAGCWANGIDAQSGRMSDRRFNIIYNKTSDPYTAQMKSGLSAWCGWSVAVKID